jgi:maltose alpha-D-glucosyltransferase/alpha-amylase
MLVMVHQLESGDCEVTVLNFSDQEMAGTVRSEQLETGSLVTDLFSGEEVGSVDDLHSFYIHLEPYQGTALLVTLPEEEEPDAEAEAGADKTPGAVAD